MVDLGPKGAYLFKKGDELVLMIYAELSSKELQEVLPFSKTSNSTHMIAYFVNFTDFIGCSTQSKIRKEISDYDMVSIYDPNVYQLDDDQQKVETLVKFAKIQLSHLKERRKVAKKSNFVSKIYNLFVQALRR